MPGPHPVRGVPLTVNGVFEKDHGVVEVKSSNAGADGRLHLVPYHPALYRAPTGGMDFNRRLPAWFLRKSQTTATTTTAGTAMKRNPTTKTGHKPPANWSPTDACALLGDPGDSLIRLVQP
jgi:hypothetical protein